MRHPSCLAPLKLFSKLVSDRSVDPVVFSETSSNLIRDDGCNSEPCLLGLLLLSIDADMWDEGRVQDVAKKDLGETCGVTGIVSAKRRTNELFDCRFYEVAVSELWQQGRQKRSGLCSSVATGHWSGATIIFT